MQLKALTLAAFAGAAVGQEMMDLTSLLTATPSLSNLTSTLQMFPDLLSTLGGLSNITVLAPSNEAFTAFMNGSVAMNAAPEDLQAILMYHVLNGSYPGFNETAFAPTALMSGMYANVTGGQVVEAMPGDDNSLMFYSGLLQESMYTGTTANFTGGVVHIIDTVLTLPLNISVTAVELNLSSAAGALINADLVDTVQGLSDITMFVPNNEAFQRIGSALPNLTMEEITSILTYHVVEGTVGYSTLLENGTSLATVEGTNVTITIEDGSVYVNSAMVTVPDVIVANGVVHVINGVLNPMNATATPNGDGSDGAFDGASSVSDSPFTSGVPTPTSMVMTTGAATEAGGAAATTAEGIAPLMTGAVGAAALFGGAAALMNM